MTQAPPADLPRPAARTGAPILPPLMSPQSPSWKQEAKSEAPPAVEAPVAKVETPVAKTEAPAAKVEAPKVETPKVETPKVETPPPDTGTAEKPSENDKS